MTWTNAWTRQAALTAVMAAAGCAERAAPFYEDAGLPSAAGARHDASPPLDALVSPGMVPVLGTDADTSIASDTGAVVPSVPRADAGGGSDAGQLPADAAATARAWPAPDWSVQSPEEQGMDSKLLERARDYAFVKDRNTQSVLVSRGGVIVAEWYADGSSADSLATSWSVGKSFASALVGIAIDEGLIKSVDVSMAEFIPSWAGTDKAKIRLRDVLQQASGLKWSEEYNPLNILNSDVILLTFQDGTELRFASERSLEQPPGTTFNYSSGNSMLLSEVIRVATGKQAGEYAKEKLFVPLGMKKVDWWTSASGHTLTFCCIDATTRDFARFGLLYARGGMWNEKQLLSRDWVAQSVASSPSRVGYGYQWWLLGKMGQEGPPSTTPPEPSTLPPDTFAAIGVDMQLIYIVPHLDLVVVRNGAYKKEAAEPVAKGGLVWHIPPEGINPDLGTRAPASWRNDDFLKLVLAAVQGR